MPLKISDEIDEDISLFLDHLKNKRKFKLQNPGCGTIDKDIFVVIDLFSYKLTVQDIDYVLAYDPGADQLTFTIYVDSNVNNFSRRYYRKKYYNIQRYIDDEAYFFQQSTVHKLLFTREQLIELTKLYQYYKIKLVVDHFNE